MEDGKPNPEPAIDVLPPAKSSLRTSIQDVFEMMGGTQAMLEWAQASTANRRIFYKDILTKVIPKEVQAEVSGPGGGPVKMVVEWAGGPPDPSPAAASVMNAITSVASDE